MIKIQRLSQEDSYKAMSDALEDRGLSAKVIDAYKAGLLGFTEAGDEDGDEDGLAVAVYDRDVVINDLARQIQIQANIEGEPLDDDDAFERAADEFYYDLSYMGAKGDPIFVEFTGDQSMSMDDYQANAIRTARGTDDPAMLANWGLGLAGEAGEVIELIKKALYHGKDLDKEALTKELGDVLWYVALICEQTGIRLDDVAEQNITKLADRYPTGFVMGGGKR